jgi:GntR family transcriptional regulator/MocR family aminotransferase
LLLDFTARRGRLRQALRAAIEDGRLPAGTVLHASRQLASQLGVSRGVASDTYDQLACEGYLQVRPRSAPVVAPVAASTPAIPERHPARWRFDFTAATPDVGQFPRRAWTRAVQRAAAGVPDAGLDYGDYHGRAELRSALSSYLGRVRGVRADPGRIVITQGFTQALDLLCHVLAGTGRTTIAMESPSHPGLWATVRQSGLTLADCLVDEHGLRVDRWPGWARMRWWLPRRTSSPLER